MKILISAPIQVDRLAGWLPHSTGAGLPVGFGGVPSTTLALGLLARGHELVIVTLDPDIQAPVELRGNRIEVRVGPSRLHGRARDYFRLERAYIRSSIVEVANQVDVVSAHWAYEFALGALSTRVPTAVHLHDWAPAQLRYSPRGSARVHFAVKAIMTLDVMHRSHHLSAVSPYIASRAQRWAHGPVAVIGNPIPVDDFLGLPRRRVHGRASIIAINHGFSPRKNVATLLKAFPLIRAVIPHAQLRLIGREYEMGGPAWVWADQAGLTDGADFVGPLEHNDTRAALDVSDLVVHPSLEEACPMVLAEAMARSVPVVAGRRSGGVPWMLDDGESGVLVDVRSPVEIARGAIHLLQADDDWDRLAAAALQSSRRRFLAPIVVEQYEDLLATAASRS